MNKSVIFSVSGLVLLLGVGGAAAYWYGNQPIKEYYPNGAIKSITERKLYENTGKYQLFAQDGAKILEYNQQKGVKNGKGELFFTDGTVDVNFQNGKLSAPLNINSAKYADFLKEVNFNIDNSELKITSGETFQSSAEISCEEADFLLNMREILNVQNYENFKNFFGCLNFNKATFTVDGGKCVYEGAYQFPKYLADSKTSCDISNAEFLESYTQSFNLMNDISTSIAQENGTVGLTAGHIEEVQNFKFETDYKVADNKFTFSATTVSKNATIEQKGSFGGLESLIEDGVEFAFSAKGDDDVKKIVSSVLKNLSWADWEATINGKKRFTVSGDFNFMNGFSDPYVMSYYSNNEVTTQWKFDAKGTQLTSKYPNTNKPLFSFGMSINDGFKKAYKALAQDGLSMALNGSASFNPALMAKLQNEAVALLKGINSVSAVLMNKEGEKTISAAMALQKNFNIEQFMLSPLQFLNFKVVTYQNNQPFKVYGGNFIQGFKLNDKPLPAEQFGAETEYLTNVLKDSFDAIMAELEKAYGDLDENNISWIDSDIDPFLFGIYKGYTVAKSQMGLVEQEEMVEEAEDSDYSESVVSDEIYMIVSNTKDAFSGNQDNYKELNNETAVQLGLVNIDKNMKPINSFSGKVVVRPTPKTAGSLANDAFIVALSGIPDEYCENFLVAELDELPQEGLIGISVGNMNVAPLGFAELNKLTEDKENSDNVDASKGYFAVKAQNLENMLSEDVVQNVCSGGEKGNFVAVKYY